jgi:hypothetical protein
MIGLNYMPADSARAANKNRGLRHHPDGSSSKNYSVSEVRTGDLLFRRGTMMQPRYALQSTNLRWPAISRYA